MLIDFEDHPGVFMSHDLCASLDVGSRPDGKLHSRSQASGLSGHMICATPTQPTPSGGYFPDRLSRPVDDIWTVRVLVLPAGESGDQILTNGNVSFFQFATLICVGHTDDAVCEVHIIPFQGKPEELPRRASRNSMHSCASLSRMSSASSYSAFIRVPASARVNSFP